MEAKEAKKRGLFLPLLLCLLGIACGFAGGMALEHRQVSRLEAVLAEPYCNIGEHIASGQIQVRINGGEVEWFDGLRWNGVSSLEDLAALDPLTLARKGDYQSFEQGMIEKLEAERAQAEETGEEEAGAGETESEEKSTLIALPETGGRYVGGGGGAYYDGGGGGAYYDGGGGGGGYTDGGGGYSGGDGEDIQWSGDYL